MEAANEHLSQLRACSDEALAALFREGDKGAEAFALLLERMSPVLHARVEAAVRRAAPSVARDDLLQEAMLGFLSAITAYRPGRGASLRTFLSVCVANRLTSALRKTATVEEPLQESDLPPGSEAMDPQDIYAAMEQAQHFREVMQTRLTPLERNALEGCMDGESYETIARRLGVSAKSIDNALQRARAKLHACGEQPLRNN